MLPPAPHLVIFAFAVNPAHVQNIDLSDLGAIPVRWMIDLPEMIRELGVLTPVSLVVVGDGDNIFSLRMCYALRRATDVPLHLISATMSQSEADLARSLGATTVNSPEVAPQVIAQFVLHSLKLTGEQGVVSPRQFIEVSGLKLDLGRRTVTIDDVAVNLTRLEFELLTLLVRSAGSVISRADIVAKIWGLNWVGAENVLDTHLAHLRRKIAGNGLDQAIVNVRGVGFYFEPADLPQKASAAN